LLFPKSQILNPNSLTMSNIKLFYAATAALLISAAVLYGENPYPPAVLKVLAHSGSNRTQLETVLKHYSRQDSLKFHAACYLIANIEGHSFIISSLYDTNKTKIDFDIFDYPDYHALQTGFAELEAKYGKLDFQKEFEYFDLDTISAKFLIKQIDFAFKAWREKPWAKSLSLQDFCDYILPYRGSNEPLSDWRKVFYKRCRKIQLRMKNPSDPAEAASIINDELMSWFKFDPRFYYHPTDQGLSDFLQNKLGRCEDMTNLTIYAMRSSGIAVTSDFTPYWAKSGNNHAWNAIILPEGKVIPFMGCECNPGKYRLAGEVAKVYRKMFRQNPDNLAFHVKEGYKMPPYIKDKSIIDVTKDYTEVADLNLELDNPVPDTTDIAYLCVFNSGEWKALAWSEIEGHYAAFKDMGTNIAYLAAFYENGKIIPHRRPFILNKDGSIRYLQPSGEETTLSLNSVTKRVQIVSTDGAVTSSLKPGKTYELFFWLNQWNSLGKQTAGSEPLIFEKVPAGCLYWLAEDGSDREEERIFTFEDGNQVWW